MCWVSSNPVIVKIAEQDIKTFKVLRINRFGDLCSYFFYKAYSIGEITPEITLYSESSFHSCTHFIHRGYHSYNKSIKCKYYYNENYGTVRVGNLELYTTNRPYSSLCIVECTIPKGTKYCLNERGEYVSEQIRVDEILEEY